ncbi:MAG: ferritin-like domain-containing protein [Planctomycetota bacterium]|jgi:rubrerythrin
MTVALNAFEVFEIAEQIERNGAKFYRKAAELFDESDIRTMFIELVEWETKHEQVFRDMGKQLVKLNKTSSTEPEKKQFDPKLMSCLAVFGTVSDPPHKLKSNEKIADVLQTAIAKEQDTITFYEGLKDFVPDRDDKNKVDDIIKEERHHINILNQALKQRE